MRTIFVSISNGYIARNFFRTDVFPILAKQSDLKLVIFVPSVKEKFYRKEFGKKNVIFEPIDLPINVSRLEELIAKLSFYLIDTDTVYMLQKINFLKDGKQLSYFLKKSFTKIFSKPFFIKRIVRYLDYKLCPDQVFDIFFEKYNPDMVYCPYTHKPLDVHLVKQARKRNVLSVGLINSWDSITSKGMLRILPDKLIVHNNLIKEEAVQLVGMNPQDIFVSGMPHFDHYFNYRPSLREEFCARLGLDPKKRYILFCPPALALNAKWYQVVEFISQAINKGLLPSDLQIVIRYTPVDNGADLSSFPKDKKIFHNQTGIPGSRFGGRILDWEWLQKDMIHLADSLYHSSLAVIYSSTMNIDTAAFDKPSVNIAFDYEEKPGSDKVACRYEFSHTKKLVQRTNGIKIAYSEKEILDNINLYLENPKKDSQRRAKIIEDQCWKFDGKSGQRMAHFILDCINGRSNKK